MTGIITVPFHIGDFLSGTMHMDTLEKGAYVMLIIAHYQIGEAGLPADDKKLAQIAGVTMKKWGQIKPTLAEKFQITPSKWISKKCVEVLQKVYDKSSAQRAKALKKHSPTPATAEPQHSQPKPKPNISSKEEDIGAPAIQIWNQVCGDVLAKPQRMTKPRMSKLIARVGNLGGLEAWRDYCVKIRGSPFLCGGNDRGWKADFDFALSEEKMNRVLEGKYETNSTNNGSNRKGTSERAREAAFRGYVAATRGNG